MLGEKIYWRREGKTVTHNRFIEVNFKLSCRTDHFLKRNHVESCTWPLAEFVVMCVTFFVCVLLGIKYVVTPAAISWYFVCDVCNCFIMIFVCIKTGPGVELI